MAGRVWGLLRLRLWDGRAIPVSLAPGKAEQTPAGPHRPGCPVSKAVLPRRAPAEPRSHDGRVERDGMA